ncbi:MAG: phosphoribosyltransferase [bacterium]
MMFFRDRKDAGRQLARHLIQYQDQEPLILALPRGGVVVGFEISINLKAPLDVIVARKIGAPGMPEYGIGAIAPGGVLILDERPIRMLGIPREEIDLIADREREEMQRRIERYRGGRPLPDVRNRTVILVDDGIATGVTARAAIQAIRQQEPRQLILASPVCAPDTARLLRAEVDDFVCLETPPDFRAISLWYDDFRQTSDEEVVDLLNRSWHGQEQESGQ